MLQLLKDTTKAIYDKALKPYVLKPTYDYVLKPTYDWALKPAYDWVLKHTYDWVLEPIYDYMLEPAYDWVLRPIYDYMLKPTYDWVLKPIYDYMLKPTYDKVLKPYVLKPIYDYMLKPTYDWVLKPIYDYMLKPTYDKVLKPYVLKPIYDYMLKPTYDWVLKPIYDKALYPFIVKPLSWVWGKIRDFFASKLEARFNRASNADELKVKPRKDKKAAHQPVVSELKDKLANVKKPDAVVVGDELEVPALGKTLQDIVVMQLAEVERRSKEALDQPAEQVAVDDPLADKKVLIFGAEPMRRGDYLKDIRDGHWVSIKAVNDYVMK